MMGDMGDLWRDAKEESRKLRAKYGIDCPMCIKKQPRRIPTNMLPGQRCKVDGYRDPRPRLTEEQLDEVLSENRFREKKP
jgi:hypothetical protein